MSEISCTICLKADGVRLTDAKLLIYHCLSCDHTFTAQPHSERERYEEEYFYEKHPNWFANPNTSYFEWICRTIEKYAVSQETQRFLDVGCGTGDLLKHLLKRQAPLELHGMDVLKNSYPGVHFIEGDFFTDPVDGPFDVMATLMVIEHVDNPLLFVQRLNQNLKTGGLLILSTNNNGGMLYGLARFMKKMGLRVAYDRVYSHHHLQHFTNTSLRKILEQNGFEILLHRNHNYPLKSVDTPPASWIVRKVYLTVVALIFGLSSLLGNGFLQTYVCRKK